MSKLLITGGAGYIGSCLVPILISDPSNDVTVLDSCQYGGNTLLPYIGRDNFSFIKGDIRDIELINKVIPDFDIIIHLAAIVGYPACEANLSYKEINVPLHLIDALGSEQKLIYASTGSNYGKVEGICTEETRLDPMTGYAESKTDFEVALMKSDIDYTICRFATAFGVSPRLRLDLLVNDLVYKAVNDGYICVYQPHVKRTFIHVRDIASILSKMVEMTGDQRITRQVFNVGSDDLNYSKQDIAEIIKSETGCVVEYKDFNYDKDFRDYEVSYAKLNRLNICSPTLTIEQGVNELISAFNLIELTKKEYINAPK